MAMTKDEKLKQHLAGRVTPGPDAQADPTGGQLPPSFNASATQSQPARLRGTSRVKQALTIPVEKIDRDPGQPREAFDDESLDRLAESLKARGLLQPITVRWDDQAEVYRVIVGERRWRAAKKAGLPSLPCIVREGPVDPAELLGLQVVENALREDLNPVEQARAYQKLMRLHGWTGKKLAEELHLSAGAVSQALALLELDGEVRRRVESGEVAPSVGYQIAQLEDAEEQRALADRVVAERLTRGQVAEAVSTHKPVARGSRSKSSGPGKGRGGPRVVKKRVLKLPGGAKLTLERAKGLDDEIIRAAIAALHDLLPAEPTSETGPSSDQPEQGRGAAA